MPLSIRTANSADPEWVIARHGGIYAREFGFDAEFEADIATKMRTFLEKDDPFRQLWIAETGGVRTGSIAISRQVGDSAFLNFVLVDPDFRGQGIAGALMDIALDHARKHAIPAVRLETYSCLESARRLYAGYGFAIERAIPGIEKYGRRFDREFWTLRL